MDIPVSGITSRAGIGKGTAYDYFESKEELVACAIVYLMKQTMGRLSEELSRRETFEERIDYLLDWVEGELPEKQCVIRFLHLITDTSPLGILIHQKITDKEQGRALPLSLFYEMLQDAVERGEIRRDLPLDYMMYTIYARIVSYMTFLHMEGHKAEQCEKMRGYVLRGIRGEFGMA